MNKVLLAFCPLCGERYSKDRIEERGRHECLAATEDQATEAKPE